MNLQFHPLTPDRWRDLEQLFGPKGACGGCWCMAWRLRRKDFEAGKQGLNRKAFEFLVRKGSPPGVLAYDGEEPVGWCAIAPRLAFSFLDRSRLLQRLDEEPVWSITCFFVTRKRRRQGLMVKLVHAACNFAKGQGAHIVEAYPVEPHSVEPRGIDRPDVFYWTGFPSTFCLTGVQLP